jgi:Yip1 domain
VSPDLKPARAADREAELRADESDAAARAWWRRVPKILTEPRSVFTALRETEELDVAARSEPVLAITILAGIAGVLLAPQWGTIMDDSSVDALVVMVATFVAGLFYGAAGYFLLGLIVWLGARAVGIHPPFRLARQLVGFSALPFALSLLVLVPAITIGYGEDWFRSGGADEGTGEVLVIGIGLVFAAWSVVLVALGLRTTFRLPWLGVVGALALAAAIVTVVYVLPEVPEHLSAGSASIVAWPS